MTAFVFNCAYNGLASVRELGRRGVDVHAFDSFRNIGTLSRYGTYHCVANPAVAEEQFIEQLEAKAKAHTDEPLLLPTNDHWAAAIARHKDRLGEVAKPCVADQDVIELVLNKDEFCRWGQDRGYAVPHVWNGSEIDSIPDDAFPIAAKPSDSLHRPDIFTSRLMVIYHRYFGADDVDYKKSETLNEAYDRYDRLEVLENQTELINFLDEYEDALDQISFQEYVRGLSDRMYSIGVYADRDSDVRGIFTGRKLRGYPPDIGDCKLGQSDRVPDNVIEEVTDICADIGYQGIAEFEYKQDSQTDEFKLIEINPRTWSWVGITPYCDVSLPWIAYKDLQSPSSEKFPFTKSTTDPGEVKWIKLLEDPVNCLFFNRRAGYPEWDISFEEWRRSVQARKLISSEFALDDPIPGIYAFANLGRKLINEFR